MGATDRLPALYLNTYAPLVASKAGRAASDELDILPFVDGSIRREPDLEHAFPSISCLCRGGSFAPRLEVGDVVAYMTQKGKYGGPIRGWRLTAVLEVVRKFGSHKDAARWYAAQGLERPNNCMVSGNPPNPVSRSHRKNQHRDAGSDEEFTAKWDQGYRIRSRQHPAFVVCNPQFRDLTWSAPTVTEADLTAVFGRLPGTRNPGSLAMSRLQPFVARLGITLNRVRHGDGS